MVIYWFTTSSIWDAAVNQGNLNYELMFNLQLVLGKKHYQIIIPYSYQNILHLVSFQLLHLGRNMNLLPFSDFTLCFVTASTEKRHPRPPPHSDCMNTNNGNSNWKGLVRRRLGRIKGEEKWGWIEERWGWRTWTTCIDVFFHARMKFEGSDVFCFQVYPVRMDELKKCMFALMN